jgi:hypothetical protein
MKGLCWVALLCFCCAALGARAQQALTKQQEKNMVAFARIFGYVRYFHPSDEAQTIAWPMLAAQGSRRMLAAPNDAALLRELNSLFQPLGPTIRIFPTSQPVAFDSATLRPAPGKVTKVVSWQHQGLYTGTVQAFHNVRLNRSAAEVTSERTMQFNFLKNVDVSRFAGLPYEIRLTISERGKSKNKNVNLELRQNVAGEVDSSATQRFLNQPLTAAGQQYIFTGKLGAAAKSLDGIIVVPDNGSQSANIDAKVFVVVAGKPVALPTATYPPKTWADRQVIALVFSSAQQLAEPLFAEQLQLGDHLTREVVPGISCLIPLALAGDAAHTYPLADSLSLKQLRTQLADPAEQARYRSAGSIGRPEVRLAAIVEGWNALRHGYAYWSSASLPPDALLRQALRTAYQDTTAQAFLRTLQRLLEPLNDGHGFVVSSSPQADSLSVPLYFGKAENRVVVTHVLDPALRSQVLPGDIVLAINGVSAKKLLRQRASLISGSPQNKEGRALQQLANGPASQPLDLTLRRARATQHVRLPRTAKAGSQTPAPRASGWLAPGIYYYNLATLHGALSPADYQTLAQAKAIIFDVRCYPEDGVSSLIPMLMGEPGQVSHVSSLNMLRPDQENVRYDPGVAYFQPGLQHLPGKAYFLTDAVTQSKPEGFLNTVRGLHLGTLVGRPTSGANGVANMMPLPNGFTITYSGTRATNADGSRHHALGTQPDVLVKPTLKSIRQGQDLILETALRLAQASQ